MHHLFYFYNLQKETSHDRGAFKVLDITLKTPILWLGAKPSTISKPKNICQKRLTSLSHIQFKVGGRWLWGYMSQEPECWVFGKLFWKWFQSLNLSQSRSLRQLSLGTSTKVLYKIEENHKRYSMAQRK